MMPSINYGGFVVLGWLSLLVMIAPLAAVLLIGRRLRRSGRGDQRWFRITSRAVIGGYVALATLFAVGTVVNLVKGVSRLSQP